MDLTFSDLARLGLRKLAFGFAVAVIGSPSILVFLGCCRVAQAGPRDASPTRRPCFPSAHDREFRLVFPTVRFLPTTINRSSFRFSATPYLAW